MPKTKSNMQNDNLNSLPNENYQKFFEKFKEISTLKISDWNVNHLLGYFCKSYKDYYKIDYKFKFNTSAPSKCFEVFQVRKLSNTLSSDPELLKKYIDWIFDFKIKQAKRKITSISFITNEYTVNEFKFKYLNNKLPNVSAKIDRTTILPQNIFEILNSKGFSAKTYGDFAFLKTAFGKNSPNFNLALEEISATGFDVSSLDGVI